MHRKHCVWNLGFALAFVVTGCASFRHGTVENGQGVFASLQKAVASAGRQVEPSLVLVKVESAVSEAQVTRIAGLALGGGGSKSYASCGVVLSTNGHILTSGIIKADDDSRVTVWVGENEYDARSLKVDETLGMTVLKIDADEPLVPVDFSKTAELAVGEWSVALRPSDEESDFRKLSTLAVCQGERVGRFRRYILSDAVASGSLVVNLSGQIVGLCDRTGVLVMNDLRDDLPRFIADASGVGASADDQKKKGWFGAMLDSVNKDYARSHGLSPSSLTVLHVVKGSPSAAAGLQTGDLITGLNGSPLRLSGGRAMDYFMKSLHPRIGDKFALTVLRNDKPVELHGVFTKVPEPATLRAEDIGVSVAGITDADVFAQNLITDRGVFVTEVHRGSPAANSGSLGQSLISPRDIIVELAGQPTPTVEAFSKVVEKIRSEHPQVVLVKYYRGLLSGYAGLNLALGQKDNGEKQ